MPVGRSVVWRIVDAAEQQVAPRLESAVRSDVFLDALGLAVKIRGRAGRALEGPTDAVWHALNLSGRSEVVTLRRRVALLERELRDMSKTLEGAGRGESGRTAPQRVARS
jgi:hypothetical protein